MMLMKMVMTIQDLHNDGDNVDEHAQGNHNGNYDVSHKDTVKKTMVIMKIIDDDVGEEEEDLYD